VWLAAITALSLSSALFDYETSRDVFTAVACTLLAAADLKRAVVGHKTGTH
jgi:hypothetical protein